VAVGPSGNVPFVVALGSVLALASLAPILVRHTGAAVLPDQPRCGIGEQRIHYRTSSGSRIDLLPDFQPGPHRHPALSGRVQVTESQFRAQLAGWVGYPTEARLLTTLPAGTTVLPIVDFSGSGFYYVAAPTRLLAELEVIETRAPKVVAFCAEAVPGFHHMFRGFQGLFRASSVRELAQSPSDPEPGTQLAVLEGGKDSR
jgi:hypothetical protein